MNYCEFLFNTEEKYLNHEVLIDVESGRRITYQELMKEVVKVAGFLKNKGCQPGSIISAHAYNSPEVVVTLLASQYIGCVICLIDPLFKPDELSYYLKDSDSKLLITHLRASELNPGTELLVDVIHVSEIDAVCRKSEEPSPGLAKYYEYHENELTMLLYTSGTTSTPKGVMLSAGCFFTFMRKSNKSLYRYQAEDRLLCFVPFSHAYGSVSILLPALAGKASIVLLRSFQPTKIGNAIASENITHIFGVPTHYQQLLRYETMYKELRKLKAAFCAAAPLSYETALSWYKNTGHYLDEGFGITEATTLIASRFSMLPEPTGNVGRPPEGILTLEAIDQKGNVCQDGIIGELRVKGPGLMLGYYKRPQETAERIRDGWLYTGDLGYRRSDGSFVLSGRLTDFINVAGLKIAPIEIEAVLNSHPEVVDSAAVGVDDATYGQIVKAFVVLKNKGTVEERDLIKYVTSKLANFKVPKYIMFLEEFPRNNLGKIDKKALKLL